MSKNNSGVGAASPKEGDNAVVLNRGAGFRDTMSAMSNKTKSPHPASDMNNKWTDVPGSGCGGNVKGYGD